MNGSDKQFLILQLVIQGLITLALLGFALYMYAVVGGPSADTIASLVVGGVMTHWFKESAQIARTAQKTENVDITTETATISEEKPKKRGQKGYSLVELLVLILIVLIAAAVIVKVAEIVFR